MTFHKYITFVQNYMNDRIKLMTYVLSKVWHNQNRIIGDPRSPAVYFCYIILISSKSSKITNLILF